MGINIFSMKKITLSIFSILLCMGGWAQKLDRSVKPKPGPAPEIKLGQSERFTLPNGMQVFVVENHKLPVVSCSIQFDIKPALEGNMAGYRDMMSELLLSGTKSRGKDKLNAEIDKLGLTIAPNSGGIYGSGLKKYQGKIFELLADIAINSNIPQAELDIQKKKALSELETQKNEPDVMVNNVSAVVNFGNNHPYGEVANEETIKNITLEACTKYYSTYFRPNVAYMAIVGDITLNEVKPIIEQYFGSWTKQDVPVTEYSIPALSATKLTKVAFAPRVAAVQSVVSVTYPVDLKPGTPDVIKARVANTILGGGSQGRLFLDLREKHAWTYGAYSSLTEDILGGNFSATVKCRNKVSDSAVGAILDEMRSMQTESVNDTTLQNSITYLSGGFAIGLEDPKRVAQYAINIERYHMPKDFYQNYLKNLSAVTAEDVMEISKKYIRPDNANIVVAGSKEEVAEKLAHFSADGKIDYYDNVGKPLVPSEMKAAPGVKADDIYKKYVAAIGGEKAINALKDIKTVSKSEMQGRGLTITEMKKAPNLWKNSIDMDFGGKSMTVQKQVFNGNKGYTEAQGKKIDITGDDLEDVRQSADIALELHNDKYGFKRTVKGIEKVNGNDAYVLECVDAKGKKSMEYYDVASSLLVRRVQGEGEQSQILEFGDYKEVPGASGYKMANKVVQTAGGQTISATVQSIEVNKGIADSEFN